jgi:hypothetical protein
VFPLPDITVEAHALGNLRGRAETLDLLARLSGSFARIVRARGIVLAFCIVLQLVNQRLETIDPPEKSLPE